MVVNNIFMINVKCWCAVSGLGGCAAFLWLAEASWHPVELFWHFRVPKGGEVGTL